MTVERSKRRSLLALTFIAKKNTLGEIAKKVVLVLADCQNGRKVTWFSDQF